MTIEEFIKKAEKIKTKPPIEKSVEKKFINYANSIDCWAVKLTINGKRGFPDVSVFTPSGKTIFIEFKRKAEKIKTKPPIEKSVEKKLTINQIKIKDKLESLNFDYKTFDNLPDAKCFLDENI